MSADQKKDEKDGSEKEERAFAKIISLYTQLQTARVESETRAELKKKLNEAIFDYLMLSLGPDDPGEKTSQKIVELHQKFCSAAAETELRCVARKSNPPKYAARTHRNEETPFYLQVALDQAEFSDLLETENVTPKQNGQNLTKTGIRVRDRHEENKTAAILKLPPDLVCGENEMFFSKDLLVLFLPHVDPRLLVQHALAASQNTISDDLCGTEIQVIRIGVYVGAPLCDFKIGDSIELVRFKNAFRKSARSGEAFMQQHVVQTIYEDWLPIGYHVLGTTMDQTYAPVKKEQDKRGGEAEKADRRQGGGAEMEGAEAEKVDERKERLALIDVYIWQVRRFYVDMEEPAEAEKGKEVDEAQRKKLAIAAGVADLELDGITSWEDVRRSFVFRKAQPNEEEGEEVGE